MNKKSKKKQVRPITFISLDLDWMSQEPFRSVTHRYGRDYATTFLAICTQIIKKGHYEAQLGLDDEEQLCSVLKMKQSKLQACLLDFVEAGFFNKDLYSQERFLTNEFVQKSFFRASHAARKENISIPLDRLCLPAVWRKEYQLALNKELDTEVMQYVKKKDYEDACLYYGGEEAMNRLISSRGWLFQQNDAARS